MKNMDREVVHRLSNICFSILEMLMYFFIIIYTSFYYTTYGYCIVGLGMGCQFVQVQGDQLEKAIAYHGNVNSIIN